MATTTRRALLQGGSASAATLLLAACGSNPAASADKGAFPTHSVELIIPFASGGSSDLIGRTSTKQISGPLGHPVVVVNRPGGGGAVGTKEAVTAPADGYRLALAPTSLFTISPVVSKRPTGLALGEIDIVTGLTREHIVLVVHNDSPYGTLDDLLRARGRSRPDTFGHSGAGTGVHFAALMLFKQAGVAATGVPFDGSGPAVKALLSRRVDVCATQVAESIKEVHAGALRQLCIFSDRRSQLLPDVPTAKERGFDFTVDQIRFVAAPVGTPPPVLEKLRSAFLRSTQAAEYGRFLQDHFIDRTEVRGDIIRTKVVTDLERYKALAKRHGVRPT
jgi:tripartite-type tricarboxylate transporter receptor subunit TctC